MHQANEPSCNSTRAWICTRIPVTAHLPMGLVYNTPAALYVVDYVDCYVCLFGVLCVVWCGVVIVPPSQAVSFFFLEGQKHTKPKPSSLQAPAWLD